MEATDRLGRSALHCAAGKDRAQSIELLIQGGLHKDLGDTLGSTALHVAAKSGNLDSLMVLLWAGADKEVRNSEGWTALNVAALSGHVRGTPTSPCEPMRSQVHHCNGIFYPSLLSYLIYYHQWRTRPH